MDKDAIRKMMEEGVPPTEIKAAIEKAKQAAGALATTPSSPTVSDPSATVMASPAKIIDTVPVLRQINFKELCGFLSKWAAEKNDMPIEADVLATFLTTSTKTAEKVIDQLKNKPLYLITSDGKIYLAAVDEKFHESALDETLDFFEEPDYSVPVSPLPAVTTPDPIVTTPAVATPDTPEPLNTTLNGGVLLDFIKNIAEEIRKKKEAGVFKDGDDSLKAKDIQEKFNISLSLAEEIIEVLKDSGAILNGKLIDVESLMPIINQFPRDYEIKDETPAAPVNTPIKSSTPIATPTRVTPPTATTAPTAVPAPGAIPPDMTAGGGPTVAIEADVENKERWINVDRITNLYYEILAKKYTKRIAAAVVISIGALAVGGSGIAFYKGSLNQGNTASAPDNKKPSAGRATDPTPSQGKNRASDPSPEKNISSGILNPNYENTNWWKEINPEIQKDMKEIIASENAKAYGLQFFKQIELLNVSGYININDKTRSDLYDNLDRLPEILNLSYGDTPRITACEITLEDNITKQKKSCYLRTNLSEIAKKYHRIIGIVLGGNMREMFPQGQKLSDSYAWIRAQIIAEINAKTAQK